ncbi:MAG: hypothetical protein ACFB0G_19630 [Leptolyngbyaceae cyanobacterium]
MTLFRHYSLMLIVGTAIACAIPVEAATAPRLSQPMAVSVPVAGLFHTLDVIEDVDDVLDGDFGDIDPVRDFTEDVEDAVDDVSDTIDDVTDFHIYEPFTDVDDRVEDFADDVDDTMRHISNDVEDWFD